MNLNDLNNLLKQRAETLDRRNLALVRLGQETIANGMFSKETGNEFDQWQYRLLNLDDLIECTIKVIFDHRS